MMSFVVCTINSYEAPHISAKIQLNNNVDNFHMFCQNNWLPQRNAKFYMSNRAPYLHMLRNIHNRRTKTIKTCFAFQ